MEYQPKTQIDFNITGFGKFFNILTNPTSILVTSLTNNKSNLNQSTVYNIQHTDILKSSIQGVDTYYDNVFPSILAKQMNTPDTQQVIIHLGVAAHEKDYRLEKTGHNLNNFRCPDEDNNLCKNTVIDERMDEMIECKLDLEQIVKILEDKYKVRVSESAGQFVCNYVYFKALMHCQQNQVIALFIHLPPFEIFTQEQQQLFLEDTLDAICKQILNKSL